MAINMAFIWAGLACLIAFLSLQIFLIFYRAWINSYLEKHHHDAWMRYGAMRFWRFSLMMPYIFLENDIIWNPERLPKDSKLQAMAKFSRVAYFTDISFGVLGFTLIALTLLGIF